MLNTRQYLAKSGGKPSAVAEYPRALGSWKSHAPDLREDISGCNLTIRKNESETYLHRPDIP